MGNHLILGSLLKTMHILNVSKRFMLWFCAPLSPRSIPECHNISETGIMQWCHGESWEGFQNRDNKRVILSTHTFPGPGSDLTGGGGAGIATTMVTAVCAGHRWSPLVRAHPSGPVSALSGEPFPHRSAGPLSYSLTSVSTFLPRHCIS